MSDSEHFDRAIERLLSDQSPRFEAAGLDAEEQRMLRMAQLLRGSVGPAADPQLAKGPRDVVLPASQPGPQVITRRTAFLSGLGALAAGVAGALGVNRLLDRSTESTDWTSALVDPNKGKWIHVANASTMPDNGVRPFVAGSVQGYVFKEGANFWAISRMCTHMGCAVNFEAGQQSFVCPCHGAKFDLQGRLRYETYRRPLPPLPEIKVRVRGDSVQVFGA